MATIQGASPVYPAPNIKPSTTVEKRRSVLLDCIRAFAILGVLAFHVATQWDMKSLDFVGVLARKYGLFGVDIFFPLSGFLITDYLLKVKDTQGAKVFFLRRLFRIVPLYLFAVTCFVAATWLTAENPDILKKIWITYTFLTGWMIPVYGEASVPYTITWSLSVEMFAYLLLGVAAYFSSRVLVVTLFAILVSSTLIRFGLQADGFANIYEFPPTRLDSIAIGGLVAYFYSRKIPYIQSSIAALTVATYLLCLLRPEFWPILKYNIIIFGSCFFMCFSKKDTGNFILPGATRLASIGFHSYFIYLFHFFNIEIIMRTFEYFFDDVSRFFWLVVFLTLVITQVQAVISFKFFERPVSRYGRSLERPTKVAR